MPVHRRLAAALPYAPNPSLVITEAGARGDIIPLRYDPIGLNGRIVRPGWPE